MLRQRTFMPDRMPSRPSMPSPFGLPSLPGYTPLRYRRLAASSISATILSAAEHPQPHEARLRLEHACASEQPMHIAPRRFARTMQAIAAATASAMMIPTTMFATTPTALRRRDISHPLSLS